MNLLDDMVSPRSTRGSSHSFRTHRPRSFAALTAITLASAVSLLPSSAHAQAIAAAPPTVVTVTPNESAVQLAKIMHVSVAVAQQIQAIDADKDARTPTQQKISSDLIYAARMAAGQSAVPGVPTLETIAKPDANGMVKVVIRLLSTSVSTSTGSAKGAPMLRVDAVKTGVGVAVTLTGAITVVGGQVLNDCGTSMVAIVPLAQVETLAARVDVGSIDNFIPPRHVGSVFGRSTDASKRYTLVPYLKGKKAPGQMRGTLATALARAGVVSASLSIPFDSFSLSGLLLNAADYNGTDTGTIDEGVTTHAVASAYTNYGVSGMNSTLSTLTTTHPGGRIRIGVLSDSDTNLASSQSHNDTPATDSSTYGTGTTSSVTEVVDDTQSPAKTQTGTDISMVDGEGTAMMEIVHDMIPDAKIFFASADYSEAQFAKNILLLRFKYHCDIIVDDVGYFDETIFSDGPVAQAVNRVTSDGGLYFSSAGNEGHLSTYSYPNSVSGSGTETNAFTAATWEGDFASGGSVTKVGATTVTGTIHAFNSGTINPYSAAPYGQTYNTDVYPQDNYSSTAGVVILGWADPATGSSNDYDLYVTNPAGTTTYFAATTTQNGSTTSVPYEFGHAKAGYRLYILQKSGASARALHLTTYGAYYLDAPSMQFSTTGTTFGHNATTSAFGVAAVPATTNSSYGSYNPNAGSAFMSNNTSENFSSDGPRTVFYNVTGGPNLTNAVAPTGYTLPESVPTYAAIGTGLFSGTTSVRNQPVVAAADGVTAGSTSGFSPFFGTSAAAPHAASIAGLVMSYASSNSSVTGVPGLAVNGGLLSVADMHTVLQSSAIDIEAAGYDVTTGYGIVMPAPAIAYLNGFLSSTPTPAATAPTTETIAWTTRLPASTVVNYGTTPLLGNTYTGAPGVTSHAATLTGLIPGTTYYYTITTTTATGSAAYTTPTAATFATTATAPAFGLASVTLATSNGTTTATITIANNGTASSDVQVTAAKLGNGATSTPLAKDLGAMAGGGTSATFTLAFPAIASGTRTVLTFSLTDATGAVNNFTQRITAP